MRGFDIEIWRLLVEAGEADLLNIFHGELLWVKNVYLKPLVAMNQS